MPRFINPKHLMGATKNSLSGLVFAWKGEQAFRHEVLVLVVLAALLAVTGKDAGQWLGGLGGWGGGGMGWCSEAGSGSWSWNCSTVPTRNPSIS